MFIMPEKTAPVTKSLSTKSCWDVRVNGTERVSNPIVEVVLIELTYQSAS